jgi:hypothetical protein
MAATKRDSISPRRLSFASPASCKIQIRLSVFDKGVHEGTKPGPGLSNYPDAVASTYLLEVCQTTKE